METVNNQVTNPIVDNVVKAPTKDDKKVTDNLASGEDDSDSSSTDSDDTDYRCQGVHTVVAEGDHHGDATCCSLQRCHLLRVWRPQPGPKLFHATTRKGKQQQMAVAAGQSMAMPAEEARMKVTKPYTITKSRVS